MLVLWFNWSVEWRLHKRVNIFKAKPTPPQVQNLTHLFLGSLTSLIIIMMVININLLTFLSFFCTQCTFILPSIDWWMGLSRIEVMGWLVGNRKLYIPMTTPSIVLHQPLIDSLCILLAPWQQNIWMALFLFGPKWKWEQNGVTRERVSRDWRGKKKKQLELSSKRGNWSCKEGIFLVWEAKRCGDQKKDNWDPLRWFVK